jgi:hypothetical protein
VKQRNQRVSLAATKWSAKLQYTVSRPAAKDAEHILQQLAQGGG